MRLLTGWLVGGSSPLARGLRLTSRGTWVPDGIIPARAGFTWTAGRSRQVRWDHPRSRGVYETSNRGRSSPEGSSPLARGLPSHVHATSSASRIIPARAGFTSSRPGKAPTSQDHPRSRGVYILGGILAIRRRGSSPLARGLHHRPRAGVVVDRIIPARAGFTTSIKENKCRWQDHPRSRGVYTCGSRTRT